MGDFTVVKTACFGREAGAIIGDGRPRLWLIIMAYRMIIVHEVILPHLMKACSMKFLLILCSAVINTIITIMSKHRRTMLGNV